MPIAPHFDRVTDFISAELDGVGIATDGVGKATGKAKGKGKGGGVVFVHCRSGIHRSPAMVMAFLVRHRGLTPSQAREVVVLGRPIVRCAPHHMSELNEFATRLAASATGDTGTVTPTTVRYAVKKVAQTVCRIPGSQAGSAVRLHVGDGAAAGLGQGFRELGGRDQDAGGGRDSGRGPAGGAG